jgi:pyruvate kinase
MATRYSHEGMDKVVKDIRDTRGLSTKIARALGIERAAVYQWKRVPPHWVIDVSKIIGVPPEKVRPDIFGKRRTKAKGN